MIIGHNTKINQNRMQSAVKKQNSEHHIPVDYFDKRGEYGLGYFENLRNSTGNGMYQTMCKLTGPYEKVEKYINSTKCEKDKDKIMPRDFFLMVPIFLGIYGTGVGMAAGFLVGLLGRDIGNYLDPEHKLSDNLYLK